MGEESASEKKGLFWPGRGYTWCYLRSAPALIHCSTSKPAPGAPALSGPRGRPRFPTPLRGLLRLRARPAARSRLLALALAHAHAHAAPGRPRRCHGGGEQPQWARGQPREPGRGKLWQ